MDNNANDSGSRVTRSLRKRLTSVDTDNSSRSGTPTSIKLSSISEICSSPSRSTRMTRRNSTTGASTPVKTPAKKGAAILSINMENTESLTPARRNTRRRSVSVYECEETQSNLKMPVFTELEEETAVISKQKSTRIRSSQCSFSQQTKMSKLVSIQKDKNENQNKESDVENANTDADQKRGKQGLKCKTQECNELQADSDVEISVLGNEIENIKKKSSNIATIVLTDDESNETQRSKLCADEKVVSVFNKIKSMEPDAFNTVEKDIYMNSKPSEKENFESIFENEHINEMNFEISNESSVQNISPKISTTKDEKDCNKEEKLSSEMDNIKNAEIEEQSCSENTSSNKPVFYAGIAQAENIDSAKADEKDNVVYTDEKNDDGVLNEQVISDKNTELEKDSKTLLQNETNFSRLPAEEFERESLDPIATHVENFNKTDENTEVETDAITLLQNEANLSRLAAKEFERESLDPIATHVENYNKTDVKESSSSEKIEILSVSTLNFYPEDSNIVNFKMPTKKVDFITSPSKDMTIKNVYPKTPASAKTSNIFIEINLSHEGGSSHTDSNLMPNSEFNQKIDDKLKGTSQINKNMTPDQVFKLNSRSLESVQSSTPINTEGSKYKEVLPENENGIFKVEDPTNKNETRDGNKEQIAWVNPNVKRTTAEGAKLDVISTQNNTGASFNKETYVQQVRIHKKKSIIFSSEDEGEDTENAERGKEDDEECELGPGEEPYKQKHDFHDDEAMEIDDYESGDSMDSNERNEIETNEIPIDGESIGSHTTEDEHEEYDEENDSENADSFIVSDNEEELECFQSNDEEEQISEYVDQENQKKKKIYKRLQSSANSSSSSDDNFDIVESREKLDRVCSNSVEVEQLKYGKEVFMSQSDNEKLGNVKSSENILDSSKLSDSALRLQCTAESESERETNAIDEETMNVSRKEILRKLNQSDRFNKSVRDLNPEIDTSSIENLENQLNLIKTSYEQFESNTSISTDESRNKIEFNKKRQSESLLGEVSVTSESDPDKENVHKPLKLEHQHKSESGLNISFGNYKKSKNCLKGRHEWQRSFNIDVTVKDGDLETIVTDLKLNTKTHIPSNSSSSSFNEEDKEENTIEGDIYSDNIKNMPLGNPLIRTRRQSLALPTNPDMEICSSSQGASGMCGKKLKRKSLGTLSSCEFNPSQSFIDTIELHKSELMGQKGKRKRLSKSFCGVSESHDNSIVDIDVRHLHKRSKLLEDNSIVDSQQDSIENINSSKISSKGSSTPRQINIDKNDSNNNIQDILNRCDEILEAANRAKLEAKLNNKKNNGKPQKNKSNIKKSLNDKNPDKVLEKELESKRKGKTLRMNCIRGNNSNELIPDNSKTVLSQAIKAANVILGKNKHTAQIKKVSREVDLESKRLSPDVLKSLGQYVSTKKKINEDFRNSKKCIKNLYTASTSAGNFLELPQTPEKKRKHIFIQLPTGKVSVEPITPQKRTVLALNGAHFRESPITPMKNAKRKRYCGETQKESGSITSQWTQSGLFKEEEIPKNRLVCIASKKIKNRQILSYTRLLNVDGVINIVPFLIPTIYFLLISLLLINLL
ncbi:slender lobes isoform 2-T2 [Cochliomyia hominivorax]